MRTFVIVTFAAAILVASTTVKSFSDDVIPILTLKQQMDKSPVIPKDYFLDSLEQGTDVRWRSVNIVLPNGQLMFVRCMARKCDWGFVPVPKPPKISQR